MSKLDQTLLESYFDGELSEKEAKKVEELLASSQEHADYLPKLGRVSDMINLMHNESISTVDFGGLRASIIEQVEQVEHQKAERLSERIKVWWAEFFEHRQIVWVPSAVVAGAAAIALVFVTVFTSTPEFQTSHPRVNDQIWQASHQAPTAQVVKVDYQGGKYSVYDLQNTDGGKVAVVWLEEGL